MVDALKFIKQNIPEGKQAVSFGIMQFTEGLTKWFKVLQKDYPNFVANYYFDFVNVPEKCKQLLNIILCAVPQHFLAQPDAMDDDILIDGTKEMKSMPEVWSNFDQVIGVVTDLKLDLQSKSTAHVKSIVAKIEQSEETYQDIKTKNSVLIHAILLFISKDIDKYEYSKLQQNMKEYELIKQICIQLSPDALYVFM